MKLHGQISLLEDPNYKPNSLIDSLLGRMQLKNDAALAKALEVAPPVISKIRHRRLPITGDVLLRMHDATHLPVNELRKMMGVEPYRPAA